MFEQLTQLIEQFGSYAVVNNSAVPNEHNEAVLNEASNSIMTGLKKMVSEDGGTEKLADLFQGNNAQDISNPVIQQITQQLTSSLGEKFGLSGDAASGVANGLIPQILGSLVNKAKDPNESGFQISDIIGAISGSGAANSGIMDVISKYGGQFGLDQNRDGQVNVSDAIAAVTKNSGGIGGLIGSFFGK
jgi:hypothetical protein